MLRGHCSVAPSNLVLDKSIFHFRCTESLNKPPVADSGPDQKNPLEKTVLLDASDSFDPDGDTITSYQWSIDSVPVGSEESLKNGTLAKLKFVPNKAGEYLFSLKVSDGKMIKTVGPMRLSVVINQPPTGKASVSPSSRLGLAPLKVFLTPRPARIQNEVVWITSGILVTRQAGLKTGATWGSLAMSIKIPDTIP